MFDKLLSQLKELENTKSISIPIDADKEGYLDKECPNTECMFQFKVLEEDWGKVSEQKVFCPMCRHEEKKDSWWTTQQLEKAKEQALQHIHGLIGQAIRDDAKDFNSRQSRNSFISMSVKVSGTNPYHYILPVPSLEEMLLKITCKECNTKYAVIGSAFFCPNCGHNSAEETFGFSMLKIENKLKNISVIQEAVEAISKDEAATTCRSLIETSLNECVVAFQRFCEVSYSNKAPSKKIKFNAFQNLDIGGEYWKELLSESYSDWLSPIEFEEVNILFQKRHLISHTEGIIDQKYLDKSGDKVYNVGQRIVVKEKDIIKLITLVKKIVNNIRIAN
jgi:uncharacterized Zn finger protein (UPF0148 family)